MDSPPIKPKYWYFVDMSNPANPVADRCGAPSHTRAEFYLRHQLKGDQRVFIESGKVLLEYGFTLTRHFAKMGYSIRTKVKPTDKERREIRMASFFPWPDYPKENWFKKLREAFPDEVFVCPKSKNLTRAQNKVLRAGAKNQFYKNLYKRYELLTTI